MIKNQYQSTFKTYIVSGCFFLLLALFFTSCFTIECEEFDLNRKVMQWHFFPDLQETYTYKNENSDRIEFSQTVFERSQFEKKNVTYVLAANS